MKKIFLLALGLCLLALTMNAATVTYTADNTSIFKNPERGFTEELSNEVSDTDPHVILNDADWFFDETGINSETGYPVARPAETLVLVLYNLKNYRTKALSNAILQGFEEDMQVLRNKGFKCVLRFAYSEKQSDTNDAGKDRVLAHINQLKPHLAANSDVIYALEAGFVGVWGEWYYSKYFGNKTQHMNEDRIAVIDALLDACPTDRFLLVRYPMIKTEYLSSKGISTSALTSTEGFSNIVKARIGCHNDAFLNTYGDNGTYASDDKSDDPNVRAYIASETLYVPNGGETNVEEDDVAASVYDRAETQMSEYHWSFCGESYAVEVTNRWHENGIFDNLNRKMGYRYQLTTATLPESANPGGKARFQISIKNVGYAPLYNYRRACIVLKNSNHTYSIPLSSDPRRWLPNGEVTNIDENLTIPSNVATGTYQLYLHMPDTAYRLADDPRFAIRFANENVWDSSTGMNNLNASIQIAGGAATPDPELSVSAASISFGEVTVGTAATKTFTVTGSNLTGNVTISSNNSLLNVLPTSLTPTQASNATITLSLTASEAGSGNAVVTCASNGATSKTVNVTWTAKTSGGGGDPTPSDDAVELPATLNKANMYSSSDNTWWATNPEYYDFGSTDAANTDRYIDWKVYLRYPGKYTISAILGFVGDDNTDGFTPRLQLLKGTTMVSQYDGENTWAQANVTYATQWDLSAIGANEYILRAMNVAEWEQPKLKSLTLMTDVPISTAVDEVTSAENAKKVLVKGQLLIIRDGKVYTATGMEIK